MRNKSTRKETKNQQQKTNQQKINKSKSALLCKKKLVIVLIKIN